MMSRLRDYRSMLRCSDSSGASVWQGQSACGQQTPMCCCLQCNVGINRGRWNEAKPHEVTFNNDVAQGLRARKKKQSGRKQPCGSAQGRRSYLSRVS
jgi:hypothetical protein